MAIQEQTQEALDMASSVATALCFLVFAQNALAQQSMFPLIYHELPNNLCICLYIYIYIFISIYIFMETFQNAFELLLLYAL